MIYHFTRRATLSERPKQFRGYIRGYEIIIPENALIFNAPRPLCGTVGRDQSLTWQADFLSGVFYAAILPDDEHRHEWIRLNKQDQAVLVWYVSEEEAKALVKQYTIDYLASHPKASLRISVDDFVEVHWKEQFFNRFASRPVGIDSETFTAADLLEQKEIE